MQTPHILIQRWFPEGEGWAYDSGISDDVRARAVSAISSIACKFTGSVIESNTRLDEYKLFVRIEPDIHCLDPKAISRNPHLDIGVLIPDNLPYATRMADVYINGAKRVRRRGQQSFNLLTGCESHQSEPESFMSCLVLVVILAVIYIIGFGLWKAIPKSTHPKTIEQKETIITPADIIPVITESYDTEHDFSTVPEKTIESETISSQENNDFPQEEEYDDPQPEAELSYIELRDVPEYKIISEEMTDKFPSLYGKRPLERFNEFIIQINKPRKWLTEEVKKSNHVDALFLKKFVEHYSSEDIALFNDSKVLQEEYDAKIKEICDAFGVNKFEEIVEKLNRSDFYVYQASGELNDYVNPLPKEVQEWVEVFYNDKPLEYKHKPLYNNVPEEMKEDAVSRLWLVVSANFAYLNMPLTVDEARNLANSENFNKDFIDKLNEKTAAKQWRFDTNDDLESVLDEVHAIFDLENKTKTLLNTKRE